jgi:uncharacterized protein
MHRFLLVFLLLFLSWPARAETPAQIPNPLRARGSWVADEANVIDDATERRLNNLLSPLNRKTGAQFAVVTINSLGGLTVEEFANDLFRRWGIGRKGEDDGLLVLAAISDRKYRVEVGYGPEGILPDAKAGTIAREILPPAFRDGNYGTGLYATTLALAKVVDPALVPPAEVSPALPPASRPASRPVERPIQRPNSDPGVLVYPAVGGGIVIALMGLLVFLFPLLIIGGVVWGFTAAMKRPLRCSKCRAPVQQLSDVAELPSLSPVQQFEQQIGARDYRVWRCEKCHNQDITAHDLPYSQFEQCPTCRHQTASSLVETVREPTPWQGGLERVILSCQWPQCKSANFYNRATPPARRGGYGYGGGYGRGYGSSGSDLLTGIVLGSILNGSHHSGGGWGGGGDSGGGWSGGDSGGSSGGFDAGPSDFGGGDSGGGGASGDW